MQRDLHIINKARVTSFQNADAAFFQPKETQQCHGYLTEERDHRQNGSYAVRPELVLRYRDQAQILAQYHRKMSGGPERIGRDFGHVQKVTAAGFDVDGFVGIDFEPSEIVRQFIAKNVPNVVQIHTRFMHIFFVAL